MRGVDIPEDGNVLAGVSGADDAGVYRLSGDTALVQTLDFITPIVDDPFTFGRIAAANSLSDVYAMGGTPLTALNIVCFPTSLFSLDRLASILKGGLSAIVEAGAQLLGGHSVDDKELKYGLSVTGLAHPGKLISNRGLRPGDAIILTKALGTGIIATALKAGLVGDETRIPFEKSMAQLNKTAAEVMRNFPVRACTDVTGFGLGGHLKEVLGKDNLIIEIYEDLLPVLPGAIDMASQGMNPAGLYRNRDFVGEMFSSGHARQEICDMVFDPQTSGGLLIALERDVADDLLTALHSAGVSDASLIASVASSKGPSIVLV